MQKKVIVSLIVVASTVIVAFVAIFAFYPHAQTGPLSTVPADGNTVYYTIIESDRGLMEGMNGSAFHVGEAWPVIQVKLGDTVIIRIISENATEVHGFTIVHYFDPGVALEPGGTYTTKFVADQNGTFIITCLIFCAIHPLMDFGKFIVNA